MEFLCGEALLQKTENGESEEIKIVSADNASCLVIHNAGGGDANRCHVSGGYANLVAELFAKHCDIVYDRFTGAAYQSGSAVLCNDLKFFIYNSGGNVGSAKVNTNAIHGKSPFYRMVFLAIIIKHFWRFVKSFLKKERLDS